MSNPIEILFELASYRFIRDLLGLGFTMGSIAAACFMIVIPTFASDSSPWLVFVVGGLAYAIIMNITVRVTAKIILRYLANRGERVRLSNDGP